MPSAEAIANAVGELPSLSADEREAILEIAYAAVASDSAIDDREREALLAIARRLGEDDLPAMSIGDRRVESARLEAAADREVADARLRRIARRLERPEAKAVAFKASLALAHADEEASDGEFEFELELIDALGLPQTDADRLSAEVAASLPDGP